MLTAHVHQELEDSPAKSGGQSTFSIAAARDKTYPAFALAHAHVAASGALAHAHEAASGALERHGMGHAVALTICEIDGNEVTNLQLNHDPTGILPNWSK